MMIDVKVARQMNSGIDSVPMHFKAYEELASTPYIAQTLYALDSLCSDKLIASLTKYKVL
jgi:hypothetical protein